MRNRDRLGSSSAASILASFELHDCTQVCRAFARGRCLKSNDPNDPMRCREHHDRPKGEVKCCSILDSDDPLYNKNFTACRAKMAGEECQYICSAQEAVGVTPMETGAPQGSQPGARGGQLTTAGGPAAADGEVAAFDAGCGRAEGGDRAAGGAGAA